MTSEPRSITPLLAQYQAIKREHQDVILLFRLGDFYEMFGEDAKIGSQVLDLALTSREIGKGRRVPMCGLPYHALERYLPKLLAAGHKAAVCEQTEDPKQAKGIVNREVTRIITPGTVVEESMLEERANNFLASIARAHVGHDGAVVLGIAAVDCSTGDFILSQADSLPRLVEELARLQPAEVILAADLAEEASVAGALSALQPGTVSTADESEFLTATPAQVLSRHFQTASLTGFGCDDMPAAVHAAANALVYLRQTQKSALQQIRSLRTYSLSQFMVVDATTRRNLELFVNMRDNSRANTLVALLDLTMTGMGGRMLRSWMAAPLLQVDAIRRRHEAVGAFKDNAGARETTRAALRRIADIERLVARCAAGTAHGRDLAWLRDSLAAVPDALSAAAGNPQLGPAIEQADLAGDLRDALTAALTDSPPLTLREGNLIRPGHSEELDRLRTASTEGKAWIASLEAKERERTGIKSLRVGFNQVFGYYLEVSNANRSLVPQDYIRKQTLTNAERFITPELKEYEALVLGAEEKITSLEFDLFCALRSRVAAEAPRLQALARLIAEVDTLAALAEVAVRQGYTCPAVDESAVLEITDGRHPVVEANQEEPFVPNDCHLDGAEQQLVIITGPNMAGKSTYLRQVALIALMAQMGSFVPAKAARVGVVDRIFTRVGAADDLASGRSTFMVEMTETANILNNATARSLIVLDEIGRGTSTFDGLSIAWSVVEYIHNALAGAKTLFATHYHHLNELAQTLPRVRNYRIAVKETGDHIVFLRKVVPGGTDRSYGIQVARLAGLPHEVLERAKEVLWSLEQSDNVGLSSEALAKMGPPPKAAPAAPMLQIALFEQAENPVVAEIEALDLDSLTPREALNRLADIQARLKQRKR